MYKVFTVPLQIFINHKFIMLRQQHDGLMDLGRLNVLLHGLRKEVHASVILLLIATLVLLLHYCGLSCFLNPVQANSTPKQILMETSIIPVKLTKPNVAQPPPPPATKKKPIPKLKKAPLKQKQPSMPLTTQPSDFAQAKPTPVFEPATGVSMAAENITTESDATSQTDAFRQTDINANYDSNPKPDYPMIAKIRGWQGEVILRVKVNESGISDAVEIERSSGFDALDESAVEAVKQWVFTPAKYGEEPIASAVIIPIVFTLSVGKQG